FAVCCFFTSRSRHTRSKRDWSSDVCSSDLTARDWPKGSVHYELFRGSEADIAPRSTDQPFEIRLARAGKTFTVPADRSILDVLKANGIKVKTLCTEGVCGTCRVGLLGGRADHRDEVLTDAQRERHIQVCVSRALPGETL